MINNHRLFILAIIVLVVLNIITLASLWLSPGAKNPWPSKKSAYQAERFFEKELELAADQKKQFQEFRKHHFDSVRSMQRILEEQKNMLFDQLQQPDSREASNIAQSMGQKQAELELAHFRHFQGSEIY